jgi:hypothetical protein
MSIFARAAYPLCSPIYIALLLLSLSQTVQALPQRFHQNADPISGLFGTEIGDIVWSGRYLWAATESGVARLDPQQANGTSAGDWVTFTVLNGIGRGSISALDAVGDTVWVSTIIDTATSIGTRQMGTGLSFSHDAGRTWTHIPNEAIFDPQIPSFERGPGTQIDNGCFGLSIGQGEVWAAFFAGSTVRLSDDGRRWRRALPDGAEEIVFFASDTAADSLRILADSLANAGADEDLIVRALVESDSLASQGLLHRTFSVLAYGDTVWIGTSSGLTRSLDGGQTWKNIKVRPAVGGTVVPGQIGGNWVLSIEREITADGSSIVWVGTNVTGLPGEVASMSYSRDAGETWTVTGPTFAWDFAFGPSYAWAATSRGLLSSAHPAEGAERSWEAVDVSAGESLSGTFVGLENMRWNGEDVLWVGAENGLGRSTDEGANWRIIRDLVRVRTLDTNSFVGGGGVRDSTAVTYAAPNPFSPSAGDRSLIVFSLQDAAQVDIDIYDFASRKVRSLVSGTSFIGGIDHQIPWDGRDDSGQSVANGTYFYRIQLDSGRQAFGKVVVLD